MNTDVVTEKIIGCAIRVHRALGPGLLESTYEACLASEMRSSGINFERQVALPVIYKDLHLDCGYRVDLLVEGIVIVELKSVAKLDPIFSAQMLTYLKLSGCRVGLLINFNVRILPQGLKRIVLDLPETVRRVRR